MKDLSPFRQWSALHRGTLAEKKSHRSVIVGQGGNVRGQLKTKRSRTVGDCAVICDATIETAERRKAPAGVETNGGFTIDIEEAKALRNIQRRLGTLLRKRYGQNGAPLTAAEIAEQSELRALFSTNSAALLCPPGYGAKDAMEDSNRLHQLNCKRLSPPSCGGGELKGADDEEEANLMVRVAAFRYSQEGRERHRITELEVYRLYRSNDEQAELDELRLVYPKVSSESALTKAIELRLAELQQQSK